jgi:hypothetical protein
MELGKLAREVTVVEEVQVWGCGVAGLRDLSVTCGDSDLEKIGTRPCLAISESAQIQAQKMKRAKFIVVIDLRAPSG